MKTQKIIIADSNKHFREGLKRILLNIGHVSIVGEAESGNDLLSLLATQKADIVFLEVSLQQMNGIEATRQGHITYPGTTFIAFSSLEHPRYIQQMMEAGADGYLSKSRDNYDLFRQIIQDRSRGKFISPELNMNQLVSNNINEVKNLNS